MWPKQAPFSLGSTDLLFLGGAILIHAIVFVSWGHSVFSVPEFQPPKRAGWVQLTVTRTGNAPALVRHQLPRKTTKESKNETKRISKPTSKNKGKELYHLRGREGVERSYVSLIQEHLEKYKSYPLSSRQEGEQGSAILFFKINRKGEILERRILETSGYRKLDAATMEALQQASPLPPIPKELTKETMVFKVPFRFSLF